MATQLPTWVRRRAIWALYAPAWTLISFGVTELRTPAAQPTVLDLRVTNLDYDGADLKDVLSEIERQTHAKIDVDWAAMLATQSRQLTPVRLHIRSATLGNVLRVLLFEPCDEDPPIIERRDSVVHVISEFSQPPVTQVYDVSDLTAAYTNFHREDPVNHQYGAVFGPASTLDGLAQLIAVNVHGDFSASGRRTYGRYAIVGNNLIFTAGAEIQKEIALFLKELRRANRSKPAGGRD